MPEGHSLRRLATAFNELFVGEVCELTSPQGRFTAGARLLTGKRMVNAHSYGKHLFLGFEPAEEGDADPSLWLHVHLGMYGAWRFQGASGPPARTIGAPRLSGEDEGGQTLWVPEGEWVVPEPRGSVRLRILAPGRVADLTGPNQCEVLNPEEREAVLARLGPDPLAVPSPSHPDSPALKDRFVDAVRNSTRPVADLVMDQTLIAGVGNIYRAEGLFRIGISPFRQGRRVSKARLGALWDDFVAMLNRGVEEGTIITVADQYRQADPGEKWYVYKREGEECRRCGTPIRLTQMKGRNLYWCPSCQR